MNISYLYEDVDDDARPENIHTNEITEKDRRLPIALRVTQRDETSQ